MNEQNEQKNEPCCPVQETEKAQFSQQMNNPSGILPGGCWPKPFPPPFDPVAGEKADEFILWGAGRAAAIALSPLPLADVGPLMANEGYMIYRIAETYGYSIDSSVVAMLTGVAGASFVGLLAASLLPFLKVPIAAGVTYAVGKTAKVFFASGMTLTKEQLKAEFTRFRKEADSIDWKERAKDSDANPPSSSN